MLEAVARPAAPIVCVLTDQVMPGMSGMDLISALRVDRPGLPAIVLSGYPLSHDDSSRQSMLNETFLRKPVEAAQLLRAIQQALTPR